MELKQLADSKSLPDFINSIEQKNTSSVVLGATYYIREDGSAANKAAATSCAAAATSMSVATHNAETFAVGDTIVLCESPAFTSTINPPSSGSASGYITYEGDHDGNGVRATVTNGIYRLLVRIDYLKIQNVHFTTSKKAVVFSSGGSNHWIRNCLFDSLSQQGIFGNGPDADNYSQDWLIEYNMFQNIGVSTDSASADINLSGFARRWTMRHNTHAGDDSTHGVDGVTFSNNNVAGGDGAGHIIEYMNCSNYYENCVDFKGAKPSSGGEGGSIVRDSTFSGNSGTEGLAHIQYNSRDVTFERVKFLNTTSNAIALVGKGAGNDTVGHVTVKGCALISVAIMTPPLWITILLVPMAAISARIRQARLASACWIFTNGKG
ncbi:MAG: hypothetical protein A2504_10605 [Bdellovibrionales bacterium RIFOXYD12_FULL_39_22]|nr:MAG: hypothetical protein A2385_14240 [Bdellovibrionales bacterium RIFOXYB1_FULL_39_21]OFZ40394.1 MAG: hypothetical protein A2485_02930 [Bdellovibrionales bacterium RIFOXYC12_FULL_39_17]OFZ49643.1 MAG: hypothetical protein A2404_09390 [Bdellovibrionales bacterium RIFOXYC1_FULL_39_130]OFZ77313.1 MAG: hypothetical protein A2560_06055 [Bdellovibrionales bacterium RIFOXYD1_FULL_39_84]OFZ95968.1 MAG: hypothetical protein A2504_10605 [Bdellovibrionales bacterium RIFOXYD12_FULL_39_22]HLE11229.1 hy